jgi:hypothetical protein
MGEGVCVLGNRDIIARSDEEIKGIEEVRELLTILVFFDFFDFFDFFSLLQTVNTRYPALHMAIYAVKQGSESNERLMNRFKKQVQGARLVKMLRDRLRFRKPKKRREVRLRAIKREFFRARNKKAKFYSNM